MALDPLAAIRRFESGGGSNPAGANVYNYKYKINPSYYSASGYYQITNSTWRAYAPPDVLSQYPTAISAPYDVQTQVASSIFAKNGFRDWAPYNSNLNSYINANGGRSAFSLSNSTNQPYSFIDDGNATPGSGNVINNGQPYTFIDGGGSVDNSVSSGDNSGTASSGNADYGGGSDAASSGGGSVAGDLGSAAGSAVGNAIGGGGGGAPWDWLATIAQDWLVRLGVILLGIILIAAAVWALSRDDSRPMIPIPAA